MQDSPPDAALPDAVLPDDDRPVTPARRLGRAVGRLLAPVLWALAGIGAALALFPTTVFYTQSDYSDLRPRGRVTVGVTHPELEDWPGETAAAWHPRAVTVAVFGPRLPPDPRWPPEATEREVTEVGYGLKQAPLWNSPAHLRVLPWAGLAFGAGADRAGFHRSGVRVMGGNFGGDPGPMCRTAGVTVSLWPLLVGALLWGGWRVRRGDRPASPRATLRRRLGRPWVWGLAVLGAALLVGGWKFEKEDGSDFQIFCDVSAGPADAPHPRLFYPGVYWVEPPPALVPGPAPPPGDLSGSTTFRHDAPWAGVWASGTAYWDDDGEAPTDIESSGHFSLWWPAAVALGWNLGTLGTLARRRRARGSGGDAAASR